MIRHSKLRERIYENAKDYISKNPEHLDAEEIGDFYNQLDILVNSLDEKINKDKLLYDFFVYEDILYCPEDRFASFGSYINKKYSPIKFKRVMDLASGRLCKLSVILANYGFEMYAIDPLIRLTKEEAAAQNIKSISRKHFLCDDYTHDGGGTDIRDFDLICGIEPCEATEAGIRQALKYDKPFDFLLCNCYNQKNLAGQVFQRPDDWYNYLLSLSKEIKLISDNGKHYITNVEPEK